MRTAVCLSVVVLGSVAFAAEPPAPPIIANGVGIALEGGGAKGLAHVGVLRWFEEHRIPVEFVAGTSMGGLVGGFYSMGMSPAEIEKLVEGIDWDKMLNPLTPYQVLSYRRKQDRRAFQNNLEFGLRQGFRLPEGLNSGQEISFMFDRAALPYSDLKNFNELPIPFRCVATDLNSGKQKVFQDGPLGEALRSTMSLPAFFSPVDSGSALYADGGLLNNMPVDVVKEMGAKLVIAVLLKEPPYKPGPQSALSVLGRSIDVMIDANEIRNLEAADLVLAVDMTGYETMDFAAGAEIVKRGYEAAEKKANMLSRLSVDEDTWKRYLDARNSRRRQSIPVPENIQLVGTKGKVEDEVAEALSVHKGKAINPDQLENDLRVVTGSGRFSSFSYRTATIDGKPTLVIGGREHSYAPPYVNLGIFLDGSDPGDVHFTLNGRITAIDFGGYRSELRTDISIGAKWGLTTEYYHPFTPTSRWFVAPRIFATKTQLGLYHRSEELGQYRIGEYGGALDFGYAINRSSEVRVGYETGYFDARLHIGVPLLPQPAGRIGSAYLTYDLDKLDNPIIPLSGFAARFKGQWFEAMPGAAYSFPAAEALVEYVRPINRKGSLFTQLSGGSTMGYWDTGIAQFFMGGPAKFAAYGTNEIRTDQYVMGRIGYLHPIAKLPPVAGGKLYLVPGYEIGTVSHAISISRVPTDGFIGIMAETFLGPFLVGGSIGDTGHQKWFFQLGKFF